MHNFLLFEGKIILDSFLILKYFQSFLKRKRLLCMSSHSIAHPFSIRVNSNMFLRMNSIFHWYHWFSLWKFQSWNSIKLNVNVDTHNHFQLFYLTFEVFIIKRSPSQLSAIDVYAVARLQTNKMIWEREKTAYTTNTFARVVWSSYEHSKSIVFLYCHWCVSSFV